MGNIFPVLREFISSRSDSQMCSVDLCNRRRRVHSVHMLLNASININKVTCNTTVTILSGYTVKQKLRHSHKAKPEQQIHTLSICHKGENEALRMHKSFLTVVI
uniref:Uncharacterized protein n=1 Tax=Trichobilharzia regenti TaxID=157069 RepID=A0AA85J3A2_TRIRE|nr:unnamed protein product [Trichobilharzia regenti]